VIAQVLGRTLEYEGAQLRLEPKTDFVQRKVQERKARGQSEKVRGVLFRPSNTALASMSACALALPAMRMTNNVEGS
jgi:hypothetical protein